MDPSAPMIDIENLTFAYPGRSPLFEGFSLQIGRDDAWAVIGPSGCGKTTFLYLLSGLLLPGGGAIRIAGSLVTRPRPRTGVVLQDHGLLPWATVEKNVQLGWRIRGFYGPDGKHSPAGAMVDKALVKERVDYWLQRLGIDHLREKYPAQLSRGERQRTAIARTLSLEPDLLLLDEPFSALDAAIRQDLQRETLQFRSEPKKMTLVLVTHDIQEALFMGQRILVLNRACNREAKVLENDMIGRVDFTDVPAFRERFEALRVLLGRKP